MMFSPLGVVVLAFPDAIDCASGDHLHRLCAAGTLTAARAFHNGNILASVQNAASLLRPQSNLPNLWLSKIRGARMSNRFTQYILIAMALGIVMGTIVFNYMPENRVEIATSVNLIAMLFLRLIKMIIAPLVFATLVGGIAHMGSGSKLGRVFAKTLLWSV